MGENCIVFLGLEEKSIDQTVFHDAVGARWGENKCHTHGLKI
jgi:hypothetical protein